MSGMPTDAKHERPATARDTTIGAAWAILICLGGTQVTFNVVSALRHSALSPVPVLAGLGPVLAAVLLSHLAASRRAQAWFRVAITGVMLCSMAVSIGATVEVTTPVFDAWWRAVLFGIVLDAASLLALWFIMDRHGEKAAAVTAVEQAQAAAEAARQQASEVTGKAAGLEAELTGVRAELEAALARASAPRKSRRSAPRKPARNRTPVPPSGSAPEVPGADDLSTEVQALDILHANPGISGSELGRRLGKTDRYGRELIKRLGPVAASSESEGQAS
jgi:hypothetical protein